MKNNLEDTYSQCNECMTWPYKVATNCAIHYSLLGFAPNLVLLTVLTWGTAFIDRKETKRKQGKNYVYYRHFYLSIRLGLHKYTAVMNLLQIKGAVWSNKYGSGKIVKIFSSSRGSANLRHQRASSILEGIGQSWSFYSWSVISVISVEPRCTRRGAQTQ